MAGTRGAVWCAMFCAQVALIQLASVSAAAAGENHEEVVSMLQQDVGMIDPAPLPSILGQYPKKQTGPASPGSINLAQDKGKAPADKADKGKAPAKLSQTEIVYDEVPLYGGGVGSLDPDFPPGKAVAAVPMVAIPDAAAILDSLTTTASLTPSVSVSPVDPSVSPISSPIGPWVVGNEGQAFDPDILASVTPEGSIVPSHYIFSHLPIDYPSYSETPTSSVTPSTTPSESSSSTPTKSISRTPAPSRSWSSSRSFSASVSPSIPPSSTPSMQPSSTPTAAASTTPSMAASTTPSMRASSTPSMQPSSTPTMRPSYSPTMSVSITPSQTPFPSIQRGPELFVPHPDEEATQDQEDRVAWSYDQQQGMQGGGPAVWSRLTRSFAACASDNQSPVDLSDFNVASPGMPLLSLQYNVGYFMVRNTGNYLRVVTQYGNRIRLGGLAYELHYIGIHTPSEHTINGESFPAELQFVHKSPRDGSIVVMSVMLDAGDGEVENPFIADVVEVAPSRPGASYSRGAVDLAQTMPLDLNPHTGSPTVSYPYYTYQGSLTTPPCTEDVKWLLWAKPDFVSAEQILALEKRVPFASTRPAQDLNGRKIDFKSALV